MKVTTKELRRSIDQLLTHLEDGGATEFEIEEDFYWNVSVSERYLPYEEPRALTLGQLSDDLDELRAIRDGQKEPVGYALVWAASILSRIGELSEG